MNPEEQNFDQLRQLLALKRREVPPPGYFELLPQRISNRIIRGEGELSFWETLVARLRLSASVACAFGLTVCGALAVSVVYATRSESTGVASQPKDFAPSLGSQGAIALTSDDASASHQLHVANWVESTNPGSYRLDSLFGDHTLAPATLPTAYPAAH